MEKDELATLQEIFYQNVPNSLGVQATTVKAVRSAIKFTKRVLGLNFIKDKIRSKRGTRDATDYERRQRVGGGRNGGGRQNKRMIMEIMKGKRKNGEREVAIARREMIRDKMEMEKAWVDKGKQIKQFTRTVTNRVWKETKENYRRRKSYEKEKEKEEMEKEKREEQFYDLGGGVGVRIGDEVLEDRNGDKPRVVRYGGVTLDSDEEDILRLPAKFKTAPPLDLIDIMTEVQVGGNRARAEWRREKREMEEEERLETMRQAWAAPEKT